MKHLIKTITLIALLAIGQTNSYAQIAGFKNAHSVVSEPGSKNTLHTISVKISSTSEIIDSNVVYIVTATGVNTASTKDYEILTKSLAIKINSKEQTENIVIKILSDEDEEKAEFVKLKLTKISGSGTINMEDHTLVIEETAKKDEERQYDLNIGTNFDFLDGPQAQNLYASLIVFQPEIIGRKKAGSSKKVGLDASLYQNRTLSFDSADRTYGLTYPTFSGEGSFLNKDSFATLINENVSRKTLTSVRNLGLHFGINYLLTSPENSKKFKVYVSSHAEIIRRTFTSKYDYVTNSIDTLQVHYSELPTRFVNFGKPTLRSWTQYDYYFGVSFPTVLKTGIMDLHIKPSFGLNPSSARSQKIKGYYVYQFRLIENKNLVSIGGEVRGVFGEYKPTINIYLSKIFGLDKL